MTAVIEHAALTQIDENRVRLSGVIGEPPQATTKMRADCFWRLPSGSPLAMVRLDIDEKVRLFEAQLRHGFGKVEESRMDLRMAYGKHRGRKLFEN